MKYLAQLLVTLALIVGCQAQISAPTLSTPGVLTNGTLEQNNSQLTVINSVMPDFGNLNKNGNVYTIPVYNKRISRCTDVTTGKVLVPHSSTNSYDVTYSGAMSERMWNSNGRLLAVLASNTGAAIVIGFDPTTMQCTAGIPGFVQPSPLAWDFNNPNLLYQMSGTVVSAWTFDYTNPNKPPTKAVLFDFMTACPGMPSPANGNLTWHGSMEITDDGGFMTSFSFASDGLGNGQQTGQWIVYNNPAVGCELINTITGTVSGILNGQLLGTWFPFTLHDVTMSRSGWIQAATGNVCTGCPSFHGPFFFQVGSLITQLITTKAGGHNNDGVYSWVVITTSPGTNLHKYADLNVLITDLSSPKNVRFPPGSETHMGWQATTDDTQPIFMSNMTQPCPVVTIPLQCELLAIVTAKQGYGNFRRLGPSFSSGLFNLYNFEVVNAIGSGTPDAQFLAFTSDANNTLGNINGTSTTCLPGGAQWKASTPVTVGQVFFSQTTLSQGHVFSVVTAGTTGATPPAWNTTGGTTVDGTAVMQDLGKPSCRNDVFIYETGFNGQ